MCKDPLATVISLGFSTLPKPGYSEPFLRYFLELAKKMTPSPQPHTSDPLPHVTTDGIISWEGDVSSEQLMAIFAIT